MLQCMGSTFQAEGIAWAKSLRWKFVFNEVRSRGASYTIISMLSFTLSELVVS